MPEAKKSSNSDNPKGEDHWSSPIIFTSLVSAVFIGLIYALKQILNVTELNTQLIFIAIFPFLAYLMVSGKISEFKGGGFEFKFNKEIKKKTQYHREKLKYAEMGVIKKSGLASLDYAIIPKMMKKKNTSMALKTQANEHYDLETLKKYLRRLGDFEFFRYIIFTDKNEKFVGYMLASDLLFHLKSSWGSETLKNIEKGNFDDMFGYMGLEKTITPNVSNKSALKVMDDNDITEIAIVNKKGTFKGFVSREDLISNILVRLT